MYDVVTFGSAVLDMVLQSDDFKIMKSHEVEGGLAICEVYGGKTDVDSLVMESGGGGTNSGVSFLKKGLKVGSVFKVGNDSFSNLLLKELVRYGLGTELMVQVKGGSGVSILMVAPDGGRSIMTYRGVSKDLTSAEIDWEAIKESKWFYISSLGGRMELLEDIVSFAGSEGIKVAINPGKGEIENRERFLKVLKKVEVLSVNRSEMSSLLGLPYDGELSRGAIKLGVPWVSITDGKNGSRVVHKGVIYEVGVYAAENVDTTGAGDAYATGLVYGLIKGWKDDRVVRCAAANAASVTTKVGAKKGLLDEKGVEKWLGKQLQVIEEKI